MALLSFSSSYYYYMFIFVLLLLLLSCLLGGELPAVDAEVVHEAVERGVGVPVRRADEVLGQQHVTEGLIGGAPGEEAVEVDPPFGGGAEGHAHMHPLIGGSKGRWADWHVGKDHRPPLVHSDDEGIDDVDLAFPGQQNVV